MTFIPNHNLISKSLADSSHRHTSFDPEKRAEQEIQGFVDHIQNVYDSMQKYAKTDAQKELLDSEMERYQAGYAQKYNADLAAKGRTFSSMITGGSKFPTRRHEKANQAEQNRYDDMKQWDDRAQAAILRELKKLSIEEAGGELAVMKKKIADAEEAQENYKKINTILRKKNLSDDAKVQEIMAATGYKESTARNMFIKDFAGRTGIPPYILTNNNANIRRMQERLKEMEKKEATPTGELTFEGGTIIDNAEADRIQIIFDKIPPEEIRTKLKGSGWKWSQNAGAWQRMRTEASRYSAKQIISATEKKVAVQEIKKDLAKEGTIEIPEVVLKEAVTDNSEILAALKIIKSGFDKWYSTGDTLDSKYSTDMLDNIVRETTYLTKNGNPDVRRLLFDLEKLGYKNR